jgi:hypothetical protein
VVSTDDLGARRPDAGAMTNSLKHAPANQRRAGQSLVLASSVVALAAALSSCGYASSTGSSQNGHNPASANTGAHSGTIDSCSLLSEDRLSAIVGSAVTVDGPAVEVARGRSCTYTFKETGNSILDEGTIDIAAWHGSGFFSPGTIGGSRSGIGEEAQDDSAHGVVIFRVGEDVVQVHVISPDHKADSVQIASAAAGQLAGASRS